MEKNIMDDQLFLDAMISEFQIEDLNVLYAQIRKDGKVTGEYKRTPNKTRLNLFSVSKSVVSCGAGIAIDEGLISKDEYICDEIIKLEEKAMRTVRSCLADISEGDKESCEKLMYALILSGLATQMVGNSRPASCAEHQLSHLWELEVLNGPLDALHGEMVSVGTMIVLREYKRVARAIREGRCSVRTQWEDDTELLEKTFGSRGFFEGIVEENTPEPLLKISPARLEACLDEIAGLIEELPEEEELARMMDRAGCKRSVYEIGLSEEIIPQSLKLAPYVRRRLSFLRILRMLRIEGE